MTLGRSDAGMALGETLVPKAALPVSAADHGSPSVDNPRPQEGQTGKQIGQQPLRLLGLQPFRPFFHHEHPLDCSVVLPHGLVGGANRLAILHTLCGKSWSSFDLKRKP